MSAENKIIAARTALVLEQPFFGSLALNLRMVPDLTCNTAWVNGRELGYSPKFVNSLTHEQLTALVAHEVMHVALGHPWRRDARTMRPWNEACDKAINGELTGAGFTLPPDALYPQGDEAGKSAEWIYTRGQSQEQEQEPGEDESGEPGNESGDGEPGDGDSLGEVRDAPTAPDEDGNPAPTEQEWKERTAAAAMHAQAMGSMPGGMARAVEQALKPKIDVRSLLLRFFSERNTGDYSWTRPNSRYIAQGLYLPALYSETLGEVAVMVDTSGSIGAIALRNARTIVESVIDECSPAAVSVYYADAGVCRIDRFERGAPLTWEPAGGGGTDFRPALEAIERDETPVCIVCITDLYGTFPDVPPAIPVLWLSTEESQIAPFGETVYCDE